MTDSKPFAVVFAGVPGSSKSIIASYLSINFFLPIFTTDIIRDEVKEEKLVDNINEPSALNEYEKRRKERWEKLLATRQSFIYDASVDRSWPEVRQDLSNAGYEWFLIDMELTKSFLVKLYSKTGRQKAVKDLDELEYFKQHQDFMSDHSADVSLKITDDKFNGRASLAAQALNEYIKNRE
jgi:L-rhamnose mutarotase